MPDSLEFLRDSTPSARLLEYLINPTAISEQRRYKVIQLGRSPRKITVIFDGQTYLLVDSRHRLIGAFSEKLKTELKS